MLASALLAHALGYMLGPTDHPRVAFCDTNNRPVAGPMACNKRERPVRLHPAFAVRQRLLLRRAASRAAQRRQVGTPQQSVRREVSVDVHRDGLTSRAVRSSHLVHRPVRERGEDCRSSRRQRQHLRGLKDTAPAPTHDSTRAGCPRPAAPCALSASHFFTVLRSVKTVRAVVAKRSVQMK
jgi:hypothetical protein